MEITERSLLLQAYTNNEHASNTGLNVIFTIICIVDVFGVFPVISLPKVIIDCGYTGIFVVLLVCSIQMYTAILLGRCWLIAEIIKPSVHHKNRFPYSALAEITYGNVLLKFVTFLLDLTIFGGGIPNIIVAAQNLQLLGLKVSTNTFDMSFCYWMIILGTAICPFLWMGSPKDMKLLCSISVSLVFLTFIFILLCIVLDNGNQAGTITPLDSRLSLWQNVLSAYGILVFQFDIHPTILSIQVDMMNKSKVNKAITGGFGVSLGLFSVTCLAVYLRYGSSVNPSVLEMLPTNGILYLALTLVGLQLVLSSAISNTALYQNIEDFMGIPRDFNYKRCIIRSILTIFSVFVAETVPRFDLVMSLVGGALTGPLVFILPPLFYIKLIFLKQKHDKIEQLIDFNHIVYNTQEASQYIETKFYKDLNTTKSNIMLQNKLSSQFNFCEIVFCVLIIIFGIAATIITTYWNIVNTVEYVTFSPPCIMQMYNRTLPSV